MTKKELIDSLDNYPDNAHIMVNHCNITWFDITGIRDSIGENEEGEQVEIITFHITRT